MNRSGNLAQRVDPVPDPERITRYSEQHRDAISKHGASGGSVAPAVIPTLSSPVFSNLFVRAVGVGVFPSPAGCQRPRRSTNEPCSDLSTLGAE